MNKKELKEKIKMLEENKKKIEKEIFNLKILANELKEYEVERFMCKLFDDYCKVPTEDKLNEYIKFNNICKENNYDSSEDYIIEEMKEML